MPNARWILTAVVLGSSIVFLDSSVVNVALPRMGEELPSSVFGVLEAQSYIYYGYMLTLSALLILAGALSDFHGRRRLFIIGLAGFGITSVLCGLAPNMELLIVGRLLQGAAGAILVPGSLAILTSAFHGEQQGRAFGIWAGASAATAILGPPLGGALVAYMSWRSVFLINVPLIAFALYATVRYVPESRNEDAHGSFDWLGAVVIAVALGGLTFGLIRGQADEWQGMTGFTSVAIGAAALVVFPLLMRRARDPLVPLDLFRSRNFTVTNISTFLIYGALYLLGQYMALFMIGTLGYNELAFGLSGLPTPLFLTLLSSRFGALAGRHGPRWYMTIGPALMGLGILWFVRIPHTSSGWEARLEEVSTLLPPRDYLVDVLPGLLIFGFGLAVMVAPLTTALMRSVPERRSGLASAINNAISRVGPQIAGALLFIAVTASFYSGLGDAAAETRSELSPFARAPEGASAVLEDSVNRSSTRAFHLTALAAGLMCLAGAAVNGVGIRNDELYEAPEGTSAAH